MNSSLKDVKTFSENKPEISSYIKDLQYANLIEQNKNSLEARTLSQKSIIARRELIEKKFKEIFEKELEKLRCPKTIQLQLGTDESTPVIRQSIKEIYTLEDILSEGEQKSISLAEFITEITVSGKKSPIVFDDPVSSLDIERKSEIAERLIELSRERQIIIFTHDIFFFYAIEQLLGDRYNKYEETIKYKCYRVDTDLNFTGYLYENAPPSKETYRKYEKEINKILSLTSEQRMKPESELAIDGYNNLRPAIELLVEDIIFQKTVKRYKKNIALSNFERIKGSEIDKYKTELTSIFNRACGFITAHSNPEGASQLPTLQQLKDDFEKVKEIKNQFSNWPLLLIKYYIGA